VARNRSVFEAL
jgi:hypothetical protein